MLFESESHLTESENGQTQPDRTPKLPVLLIQSTHKGLSSQEAGGVGISGLQSLGHTLKDLVALILPYESVTFQ